MNDVNELFFTGTFLLKHERTLKIQQKGVSVARNNAKDKYAHIIHNVKLGWVYIGWVFQCDPSCCQSQSGRGFSLQMQGGHEDQSETTEVVH